MRKEYKNYIFDLYGTLAEIHTNERKPEFWQQFSEVINAYGKNYEPEQLHEAYLETCHKQEEDMRQVLGFDLVEIVIEDVFRELLKPVRVSEDEILDICHKFRTLSTESLFVYRDTISVLTELRRRGRKLYLLSNAQYSFTWNEFKDTGLFECLDRIYISSLEGMKKPYPGFMQRLLDNEGIRIEESVMVGNDLYSDMGVAQAVGMDSIYLNSFAYDEEKVRRIVREQNYKDNIEFVMDGDIRKLIKLQ